MKVARTRLARTIADRTLRRGLSKRLGQEIAAYLLSERRVNELDSLLRDVQADWARAGCVEVLASSAHPLTKTVKADIARQTKRLYPAPKQLLVSELRDPTIIGGVRLRLADQQLDLSIRSKLNTFKRVATEGKGLRRG